MRFIFLLFVLALVSCKENRSLFPHEGVVQVEGGELWYSVMGDGDGTPLLMLHGGPGGTHRGFYYLESLGKDRPLILFDQLGSGRSTQHTDTSLMTVDHLVEQVYLLKEHLNLHRFYLLGHSWGSALQLEFYTKYPEGVEGIIFSSPYVSTPVWEADADTLITALPDSIQQIISKAEEELSFDTPAYRMADSVYWANYGNRNPALPHPMDTLAAPSNRFMYNYMWGPSEFTATGTLKNYDNLQALSEVKVPVLFITGEYDEARPATIRRFQKMVPGSKVFIVPDAGHATMKDNLPDMLEGIRSFLDSLESKPE